VNFILVLRDFGIKCSRDGDGINGGHLGVGTLNCWKEFFNAKAWL
jgi:hypothetical protein